MAPERQKNPVEMTSTQREEEARRLRDRFNWLTSFSDEELQEITFCDTGAEMVPGDSYFDISNPESGVFVGQPGQLIPKGGCLVQRSTMPPHVWNKLTSYPSGQ